MTEPIAESLLEAIAGNRLIVFCGAGLSMGLPSGLPSAAAVAAKCVANHQRDTGVTLSTAIAADLGRISNHFLQRGAFENVFIANVVPWADLKGSPNPGHDAVADFLACRALFGAATTNYDFLIESAATRLGEPDFRAVVDIVDLPVNTPHEKYVKLHGCEVRSREGTIWCPEQLTTPPADTRIAALKTWLAGAIVGRDLIFIGFWSDWAYLTELLADHVSTALPRSVYLVDPDTPGNLEMKAPRLWSWAHRAGITFHHCREIGSEFLDELRSRWSEVFLQRMVSEAELTYRSIFGVPQTLIARPRRESGELYSLRRDLTGVPRTSPVRAREPIPANHLAASIHRRLLEERVPYAAHVYQLNGRGIRLISGQGRLLGEVRAMFDREPPLSVEPDEVFCVGALPDPSPPHLIRAGGVGTIVRPGGGAIWKTHESLVTELTRAHA